MTSRLMRSISSSSQWNPTPFVCTTHDMILTSADLAERRGAEGDIDRRFSPLSR